MRQRPGSPRMIWLLFVGMIILFSLALSVAADARDMDAEAMPAALQTASQTPAFSQMLPPLAITLAALDVATLTPTTHLQIQVPAMEAFALATATRTPTPISLGNFVWDDIDHDGRQDAGEPGLGGVTVQLWNSAKTQLVAQTTTNGSGIYSVIAPLPGQYRIRVLLPSNSDQFSPKDQAGGDDLLDSDINTGGANAGFTGVINIANNVISMTSIDTGIIKYRTPTPTRTPTPISLGNFVWNDLDHDGRQDAGEPGLGGVTVQLWNAAKTQLIASTTTNASGNYTVVAPLPGQYRIRVLLPSANAQFSPKDQAGGDNLLDSDINTGGANAGFTDVIDIASNVISITSIDAGIFTQITLQIPVTLSAATLIAPPPAPTLHLNAVSVCAGFRLTSPLDGLPNGVATFYWDPVQAQGITYQVTVMDEGHNVLASFTVENSTSLSGDISQSAIRGGYALIVRITALQNGQPLCSSDERTILREASQPNVPLIPNVTPTPTRVRRAT